MQWVSEIYHDTHITNTMSRGNKKMNVKNKHKIKNKILLTDACGDALGPHGGTEGVDRQSRQDNLVHRPQRIAVVVHARTVLDTAPQYIVRWLVLHTHAHQPVQRKKKRIGRI